MKMFALPFALHLAIGLAALPAAALQDASSHQNALGNVGVLVMAHGGSDEWNTSVAAALQPLRDELPLALAFGMADRATLEAGIDSLRERGLTRIAVVRMFLSGASFRQQTDYLLGLSDQPPHMYMHHGPEGHVMIPAHGAHHESGDTIAAHAMTLPPPIAVEGLQIATHDDGIKDWIGIRSIIGERVQAHSTDPARERVLVLAHGMGDEAENQAVLDDLAEATEPLDRLGFASVRPETLREDWAEARALAEERIRAFMHDAAAADHAVIVVPFRLSGFGPYAKVLEGFDYRAADGLLPHESIGEWVMERAASIARAQGWDRLVAR